jgi:peptide deformylase
LLFKNNKKAVGFISPRDTCLPESILVRYGLYMILTPLAQNDPRLRQVCAPLTKSQLRTREQQAEIDALLDFVYGRPNKTTQSALHQDRSQPNTVGLSANQVGIMKQICIADLSVGQRGYSDVYVLVNPKIASRSKAELEKPEGCVNFETVWGITRRSRSVRVTALDRSGNEIELKLVGWPAILMQHEIDHINGHLFIDRLPDPTKAHLVEEDDYAAYRKMKPSDWQNFVDVSAQVVH